MNLLLTKVSDLLWTYGHLQAYPPTTPGPNRHPVDAESHQLPKDWPGATNYPSDPWNPSTIPGTPDRSIYSSASRRQSTTLGTPRIPLFTSGTQKIPIHNPRNPGVRKHFRTASPINENAHMYFLLNIRCSCVLTRS